MVRALLRLPGVYRGFARLFNVAEVHRRLVRDAGYRPGLRTLDIGCGPGDLATLIDARDYVGVDISEEYIAHARSNHGGTFHVLPAHHVGELDGPFDLALMVGVFHHMPDAEVRATLDGLARIMTATGRFVLLEAIWPSRFWDVPGYMLRRLDRGRFVRTREQWCRLLGESWGLTDVRVPRNFLIEYFTCTLVPSAASSRGEKSHAA